MPATVTTESHHRFFQELNRRGFDLAQYFSVSAEQSLFSESWVDQCFPLWATEQLRQNGSLLGILVANTRKLWLPFLSWYRSCPTRLHMSEPLDGYVRESIAEAAKLIRDGSAPHNCPRIWLGYAHTLDPCPLPIQRLAELSGLASLGPSGLVVHPQYGPWIGLRALILVDTEPLSQVPFGPPFTCTGCHQPCVAPFQAALNKSTRAAEERLGSPYANEETRSSNSNARTWLAVRDACPLGREYRYEEEQIVYHYDKDASVLSEAES